ncbi:uncharacterized protein LOC141715189 [Apium graveolens]|uniref:uncharacterized protein LOC141715189 n=1 Tax=Apium graveolens TaxID=4045 RepID=UPI003D7921E3
MSSVCISNCVNDTRVPVRARYINHYTRPESDAEIFKTMKMYKSNQGRRYPQHSQARVVDAVSCRQMYLRSYTFSRKESVPEKTRKCLGKVREKVGVSGRPCKLKSSGGGNKRRAKKFSCTFLCDIFRKLLTCTTRIDAEAK